MSTKLELLHNGSEVLVRQLGLTVDGKKVASVITFKENNIPFLENVIAILREKPDYTEYGLNGDVTMTWYDGQYVPKENA